MVPRMRNDRMDLSQIPAIKAGRGVDPLRFEGLKPPLIMGVINITPDSFSDGGFYLDPEKAVQRGIELVEEGADILDIGGESSRPFAVPVSPETELERVLPVVRRLSKETDLPLSIDTRHHEVAEACLMEGCSIINDISGLTCPRMESLLIESGATGIIMHMKGDPSTMQVSPTYSDVVSEVHSYLKSRIDHLVSMGACREHMIIDPGIGFGKTVEDNLLLIKHLDTFLDIGCPILIGTSRKSFIGKVLGIKDPLDRLEGSIVSMIVAVMNGASVVRVHDVKATKRALLTYDSLIR